MRQTLTAIVMAALTGCASVGTAFDMNIMDTFEVQKTTLQDVQGKLGMPLNSTALPDGSVIYGWAHSKSSITSASTQGVLIKFSKDGKFLQVVHRQQVKSSL